MEDDFADLALGSDPTPADTTGQAQGDKPAGTPAPEGGAKPAGEAEASQDSTPGDGTANAGKPASDPAKEEAKGVLPKELEPYKDLIESRKLDLTKPEGVAKLAQSYKEVEQFAQKSQTLSKNSQDKAARVASIASGSVEDLNKWRKSQGLPEIAVDTRPHEDKAKEVDDLYNAVDKALQGDAESLKWLNNHFAKRREDLLASKIRSEALPQKNADQAFKERKAVSQTNFASVVRANPQAKVYFDELTDHLSPGGVLDSLGVDVLDAASTPERLAAFVELGQALNTFRNLDKVVEGRVTAELERRRTAGNVGGAGKGAGGAKPKDQGSDKVADFTTLFS
jgi:hypothetical protein